MRRIKLETEHTEKRSVRGRKSSPQSKCFHEVNPLPKCCLSSPRLLYQSEMERNAVENVRYLYGGYMKMGQNSWHNK